METRRLNRAERVIQFLEQHYPGWVEATRLEPIGGRCAWRTAVSEARAIVKAQGDDIENRTRHMSRPVEGQSWVQTWTLSEYRLKKGSESQPVTVQPDAHDLNHFELRG